MIRIINLFDYNQEAYDAAIIALNNGQRTAIIHPTGTGKSFIGFKLCEEYQDKRICWLAPSEYIYKTQLENLVQAGSERPENVTFLTYAKLMLLDQAELMVLRPDYIIMDEFHRCGAQVWGRGVEDLLLLYKSVPVLGLSATHIRYLDNRRNMVDELFDGHISSEMTLGEAIVRGILPAPKYITTLYSYQEELLRYEHRVQQAKNKIVRDKAEKYLEILRRTLEHAEGLDIIFERHMTDTSGKYLVFCANKEHMDEMIAKVPTWFSKVDASPHIYKAYSDYADMEQSFQAFKEDDSQHLKLLFCIDMLNEGIHVDGVSGVILFRPTVSPIIYKQQIGRALSASESSNPVIFDIVNNLENLYSIDAIEEEMEEAIVYFRENQRQDQIVVEKFTLYEEVHDCNKLFYELNETLSTSWEQMYLLAKNYYKNHGNLEVPKRYKTPEGYNLGSWISVQRRIRSGNALGKLEEEQITRLDAIGMNWENFLEASFQKYYRYAIAYSQVQGDLDVSVDYVTEDGVRLGNWIASVRRRYTAGTLSKDQVQQLEAIGMIWEKFSYLWEQGYDAATRYYAVNQSLEMKATYVDDSGYKLGAWINAQKRLKKADKLDGDQIARLETLEIQWLSKYETQWNQGYKEATRYYQEHGNLNVPVNYINENGYKLGDWLANQRGKASLKVTLERKEKLNAIGMVWSKRDSWEERYEIAKDFYEANGHLQVPASYKKNGVWLNKWLNEQKQIHLGNREGKTLTTEQVEQLKEIGATWCVISWNSENEEVAYG